MSKKLIIFSLLVVTLNAFAQQEKVKKTTFCNPLNLSYRFQMKEPSRREGADPTVVFFQDSYYLFASKSGGYWQSDDLVDWNFITSNDLPWEDYAPTALNLGDTAMLFMASHLWGDARLYKTKNPSNGKWEKVKEYPKYIIDPALFLDDDNRLYLYAGCSSRKPIYGVELDVNTFEMKSDTVNLIYGNMEEHGWEEGQSGGLKKRAPHIEGSWMTKYQGKYYLQYGAPGTNTWYGDGVYVSKNPLGPFVYQDYSPFSFKPTGYAQGAGHGSTFKDKNGNWWHIATSSIGIKHQFERRICLYPAGFDTDDQLHCNTTLGEFPLNIQPDTNGHPNTAFTGWILLSAFKNAKASSQLDSFPVKNAFDENMQSWWAAKTNQPGEWLQVDLSAECEIHAIQINFAEHNTSFLGREKEIFHRYIIEYSEDGEKWKKLIDKSKNEKDVPHDYTQLSNPVKARYLKIKNVQVPDENFAIRDFRIFGLGTGEKPEHTEFIQWDRSNFNQRYFSVKWKEVENANGYMIEYGIEKNKLYNHFTIYNTNQFEASVLNKGVDYFFTIRTFNENGISERSEILEMPASGAYEGFRLPWVKY